MKSLQGSSSSSSSNGAVCPFAKMASTATTARHEENTLPDGDGDVDHHHHHPSNHQPPSGAACDSSASTSSWEPDNSQYEEDLAMMTQKCPIFQQQQQQQSGDSTSCAAAPRTISFSCPFKDQQVATLSQSSSSNSSSNRETEDVLRETLLKIPPSHYDMGEFVRVMEGFHHRVAIAAAAATGDSSTTTTTMLQLPKKCPVPLEIKSKISFRQAMESRSLAAIMARLAEEHDEQLQKQEQEQKEQQQQQQQQQQEHVQQEQAAADEAHLHSVQEDAHDVVAAAPSATTTTTTTTAATTTTISSSPTTSTTSSSTASSSLSHELKTGTAVSHQAAENVHFVRNFIRGQIDRDLYGKLVTSLYHVYVALEMELDVHAPRHFASCHYPVELQRVTALQADVDFWHGSDSSSTSSTATDALPMSPATRDYVMRIHDIAATNPLLLLAHSYTRYLGDLSGGKILARVARRALHLPKPTTGNNASPTDGLHFYHFEKIASDKKFKDQYRSSLDDLHHLTPVEIGQLVAEANVAFLLNMRIFEELDVAANVPGATVRPLQEALDYANAAAVATAAASSTTEEAQECPFLRQSQQPKKGPAAATSTTATTTHGGGGRCPWPFVVFHDPIQFVCDWQTMVLVIFIGLFIIWQKQTEKT